jgi:hypothetical protein
MTCRPAALYEATLSVMMHLGALMLRRLWKISSGNGCVLVDRKLEPVILARNADGYLVQMPTTTWR